MSTANRIETVMVVGVIGVAAGAVAIPLAAVGAATSVASIAQGAGNQQRAAENNNNNNSAPKEADKNDPRLAKFTLYAHCSEEAPLKEFVEGKQVVLRDHKVSKSVVHSVLWVTDPR